MKHRLFIICLIIVALSVFWTGCKTVTDLTKNKDERNLIRLQRGSYSQAGLYSNIYYEFEVQMPEGWEGEVDDPPNLLTVNPSSRVIANSSARKFISIGIKVWKRKPDETLEKAIERYSTGKNFEQILVRPSMIQGADSEKVLFYGNSDSKEMKIINLFVLRGETIIILECMALKPLFDNVEAQFGACLDSFRITGEFEPDKIPDSMLTLDDQDGDYVIYIVSIDDTPEKLAQDFLGTDKRAYMILSINEIDKLTAGERIKIPRFLPYEVKPDDSLPVISQRLFGNAKYMDEIKNYNADKSIETGVTIFIPLYSVETPVVGETYKDIARRNYNNANLAERLFQYNNMQPLESLEKVKLPLSFAEKYYTYKVQSNDTLAWISRWLTGNPQNYRKIAEANDIAYPYRLVVGQQLKVPASLVSDPSVFDKPIPKAKSVTPPSPKTPEKQPEDEPKNTPTPKPTPVPQTMDDPGLFDID